MCARQGWNGQQRLRFASLRARAPSHGTQETDAHPLAGRGSNQGGTTSRCHQTKSTDEEGRVAPAVPVVEEDRQRGQSAWGNAGNWVRACVRICVSVSMRVWW